MEQYGPRKRTILSILLFFHLSVCLITPNRSSYLYQSLAWILDPYTKILNLNHNWGFFAPEPIAPPTHIEYTLERPGAMPETGRFPLQGDPYFFRERQNRRMTLSRFLLINETNMREMLVRYLCIHNPGVTNLKLWKMVGYTPSLEQVRSGEKRMTDPIEWKITPLGDQFCPEQS